MRQMVLALARTGTVAAVLLVSMGTGCVEPHCPKGYDERGDTCYRRRDARPDAEAVEANDDDAGEDAADAAAAPNDDGEDSGEPTAPEFDASPPGASGAPGDASSDAGTVSDAASDTSVRAEPCLPNPCLHGGTCTPNGDKYSCKCSAVYTGNDCELQICEAVSVVSSWDVVSNASCGEIRGDLSIASTALPEIVTGDFPSLTRITGSLVITSNHSGSGDHLQRVTLSKLESIGGMIDLVGDRAVLTGPLFELHLPALTSIGSKVSATDAGLAVRVAFTELKTLDLPLVSFIGGDVQILFSSKICAVNLPNVEQLAGAVMITGLANVSARAFDSLTRNATGMVHLSGVGCCLDSDDKAQCPDLTDFTPSEIERYCTGC